MTSVSSIIEKRSNNPKRLLGIMINSDKPAKWKKDIVDSVSAYNRWFTRFAPHTYITKRKETMRKVQALFSDAGGLRTISPQLLKGHPEATQILRMCTAPPIARDRLIGLSGTSRSLVNTMESDLRLPSRMPVAKINGELEKIQVIFNKLLDPELLPWVKAKRKPSSDERTFFLLVVADRLCGAQSDPIIRNAQEERQLRSLANLLKSLGYKQVHSDSISSLAAMVPGTFTFQYLVRAELPSGKSVGIPIDAVIQPRTTSKGSLPILIEAKSAGDFTNVNKRRKEEAAKHKQLVDKFGSKIRYLLLLSGYFDAGYLGYEAAEGIDWVWEHNIQELRQVVN